MSALFTSLYRLSVVLLFICFAHPSEASGQAPNIIVILTDDHRYDDFTEQFMPVTKREICDRGVRFQKAYVTTPACCPSRSSIFTGMYTSQHEVRANPYQLTKPTFIEQLGTQFFTGHIGKYLNTWNGRKRREFDYWVAFQGGSHSFRDPVLNRNGNWSRVPGYITEIFEQEAVNFLEQSREQQLPFLLHLSFNAPHYPALPPRRDRGRFAALLNQPKPPSYNTSRAERADKPLWIRGRKPFSEQALENLDSFRSRQRETLPAVDRAIERILKWLEENGEISNTLFFFISDNGLMNGEHGLSSKDTVYEEAIRVPFCVRWDERIRPRIDAEHLVANIDIAATIFEASGRDVPEVMAGRSLLSLEDPDSEWRSELLIEGFRRSSGRRPFAAIHTGRYVFVENSTKGRVFDPFRIELYDLEIDPYQLVNRARDPLYSEVRRDLRTRLTALLKTYRGTRSFLFPIGQRAPARFPNPLR